MGTGAAATLSYEHRQGAGRSALELQYNLAKLLRKECMHGCHLGMILGYTLHVNHATRPPRARHKSIHVSVYTHDDGGTFMMMSLSLRNCDHSRCLVKKSAKLSCVLTYGTVIR